MAKTPSDKGRRERYAELAAEGDRPATPEPQIRAGGRPANENDPGTAMLLARLRRQPSSSIYVPPSIFSFLWALGFLFLNQSLMVALFNNAAAVLIMGPIAARTAFHTAVGESAPCGGRYHRGRTPATSAVRVGVHDASRVEWSVSVPLPEDRPFKYTIRVELRIPNNTFVQHTPWGQMQSFTRLDGPATAVQMP